MTEEIIIDGVNVAGCEYYKGKCMEYTHYCQIGCKECTDIGIKLCHYKQTERFKAKIDRLEQENKELKAYKDVNEDFKKAWDELNEKYKQLRSALEEIREIIRADCKRCTAECDCDDDCTRYKIQTKINEALGC